MKTSLEKVSVDYPVNTVLSIYGIALVWGKFALNS